MGTLSPRKPNRHVDTRLLVTLLLAVVYPVLCAALFAAFVFIILPAQTTTPSLIYWLVACGLWLALLATILPLMRGETPVRVVIDTPDSGIDLTKITSKGSNVKLGEKKSMSEEKSSMDSENSSGIEMTSEKKTPEKERIVKSNDFLNDTDFIINESKVTIHAEEEDDDDDGDGDECDNDSEDDEDFRNTLAAVKDRKNVSFEAIAEQEEIEEEIVKKYVVDQKETSLMNTEELFSEDSISDSSASRRPKTLPKIDVGTTENVYQCSSPVSPTNRQSNTVFIFVKKDDE